MQFAILHTNEGARRTQATTKYHVKRFSFNASKASEGKRVVKAIKEPHAYEYVKTLVKETLKLKLELKCYKRANEGKENDAFPKTLSKVLNYQNSTTKYHMILICTLYLICFISMLISSQNLSHK